jgi:DNA topoisomerase-1
MKQEMQGDLKSKDEKVKEAATVALLIASTGIRPGSETDTGAEKQAYGATTLQAQHVKVGADGSVSLQYTGKKGVDLNIPVKDPALSRMLVERKKAAGGEGDGKLFPATSSASLRDYVHEKDGGSFKPKDFRTAHGTNIADALVKSMPAPKDEKEYKRQVLEVAKQVSSALGNTPAVALQSYIDPTVFAKWQST